MMCMFQDVNMLTMSSWTIRMMITAVGVYTCYGYVEGTSESVHSALKPS